MNTALPFEVAGSYFNAESRESRSPWGIKPHRPFITISRESGSGGSSLAQLLLQTLDREASESERWRVFGGNIVTRMLETNHLPGHLARFLPEDRVPEINATIGELIGRHPSLWELMQKTNETIRHLAGAGNVIFVGRGANFATAGIPGGVHIRLIAPGAHRAKYVAQLHHMTEDAALVHIAKSDAARKRYVATSFNADVADPAGYDLVINTAHVPLEEAVDIVLAHIRAHATPAAA